jgi:hypothetical protein
MGTRLGLFTMIIPRAEIDHLEQWLTYHIRKGFTHFWICLDEPEFRDAGVGQTQGREWVARPEANYHPELDDDEAREIVMQIIDRAAAEIVVFDISKVHGQKQRALLGYRQGLAATYALHRKGARAAVDWLGYFDTDELVVGDLEYIEQQPNPYLCLCQRVFSSRWGPHKNPLRYNDITESWGDVEPPRKLILRTDQWGWKNVHTISLGKRRGESDYVMTDPAILRYHHFCLRRPGQPMFKRGPIRNRRFIPGLLQQPVEDTTHIL